MTQIWTPRTHGIRTRRGSLALATGFVACLGTAATAGTVTTMSFTADMYRVDGSG
ncbi:MAG: hypothetical protein GWP75_03980, partial [Planctomycetia bacterium]|nr:hypothetical protein [Planctomycetia bacterium]